MPRFCCSFSLATVALAATTALGQNAVQLPTVSVFRANTTVSVPDRGSVVIGGIQRAASGRSEYGAPLLPLRNRSFGAERSASSLRTSVFIHDFEAMDEALLGQARGVSGHGPAPRPLNGSSIASAAPPLVAEAWQPRQPPRPATRPLARSVAELRADRAAEQAARSAEAERLFERGRDAETAGKANVARIYYQQASRRAEGPLQEQALAQLARLAALPIAAR